MSSTVYLYIYELCSFSNLSVTSRTSQLILQPIPRFTYVSIHSPTLPLLHICHSSFYNTSFAHSPTFPSLHLRHSSFSNPSVALPTLQLILQSFHCFTYVTVHSLTILSLLLLIPQHLRRFTYVTAQSPTLPSLYLRHSSFSTLLPLYLCHSSFYSPSVASPTS